MAAMAQLDQQKRTVNVNRERLIETLESNKQKHVAQYREAMNGYKEALLSKVEEAFTNARKQLKERHDKLKSKIAAFTDDDIREQRDYFEIVDDISVQMKVPRSFEKEYDTAIDIAKWDVRETLELTHAEFNCFVRDQWDWKSSFDAVSAEYRKKA